MTRQPDKTPPPRAGAEAQAERGQRRIDPAELKRRVPEGEQLPRPTIEFWVSQEGPALAPSFFDGPGWPQLTCLVAGRWVVFDWDAAEDLKEWRL